MLRVPRTARAGRADRRERAGRDPAGKHVLTCGAVRADGTGMDPSPTRALALLVLVGTLTGCAAGGAGAGAGPASTAAPTPVTSSTTRTLAGTLTVLSLSESATADGPCTPDSVDPGGLEDVVPGAAVLVRDGADELLAQTVLDEGHLVLGEAYEAVDWSAAPQVPVPPGPDATQDELDAYIAATRARADAMESLPTVTLYRGACSLPFTAQVPTADLYVVGVGDRVQVDVSREDLEAAGWVVELTVREDA